MGSGWVLEVSIKKLGLCVSEVEIEMGVLSSLRIFLVVVLVVGAWEVRMGVEGLSASQCKEERRLAVNECKPVLYGKLPTPQCCERARVSHVDCICPDVTPKLAALIDVNRAVRLIEGCGRRVPRHFKCGSITTP